MNDLSERDLYAMFAMAGWIMNGDYSLEEIPSIAYDMADKMMEARQPKEELGIAALAKRRKTNV